MSAYRHALHWGWNAVRRGRIHGTMLWVLLACATLLQTLVLCLLGVRTAEHMLISGVVLHLEVSAAAADQNIQELYGALRGHPSVAAVSYRSREQALQAARTDDPTLQGLLSAAGVENPYLDAFTVTLTSLRQFAPLLHFLEETRWQGLVDPTFLLALRQQYARVEEVLRVAFAARMFVRTLLAVTTAVFLLATAEFIRALALMQRGSLRLRVLLGAPPPFVRGPFFVQTAILLVAAVIGSMFLLLLLLLFLPGILALAGDVRILSEFSQQFVRQAAWLLPFILLIEILCAPPLAFAGTAFGMRSSS